MNPEHAEKTVLIVDDIPSNLGILVDALGDEGINVAVVKSGEKAIALAEELKPDLILLDVLMPGINGFEICRRLKQQKVTKEIPVIFMTALTETVNKVYGFEAGGVDYITKPFQVEEVLARVHAHLTIQTLQQQLQKQLVMRETFFSIIAHDLRNPFMSFLSFAKILEHFEDLKHDEIEALIKQFRTSAENLFALLENLLTWSRIQRGMIRPIPGQLPLTGLVTRNVELFRATARQKQITLTNRIQEEISVYADANMLDTVLRNLLLNAVKFTEAGGTVDVSAIEDEGYFGISVSDTGIGISEGKLSKLFRIDSRCQREGTSGEKGTGLGLILCKEFIGILGGKIWATSKVGKGTTFTFTLPKSME